MRRASVLLTGSMLLAAVSLWRCEGCSPENPGGDTDIVDPEGDTDDGISEVLEAWEKKVERALSGLPTDFDGDGFEEYLQQTGKDGVTYIEIKHPSGNLFSVTERDFEGTETTLYYEDGSKNPYKKAEEKSDGYYIYLMYLMDTDDDGVFDERITNTFDFEKNENHRVFEKRRSDGTWEKTLEETVPINQGATVPQEMKAVSGAQENALRSFVTPQYASIESDSKVVNNIKIKEDSCLESQRNAIRKAFADIFDENKKFLQCFDKFNPEISDKLRKEGAKKPHIEVDCELNTFYGDQEDGNGKAKWKRICTEAAGCKISLDPVIFYDTHSDNDRLYIILHEYLHILGYGRGDQRIHKEGKDMVYSCGRFCSGGGGTSGPSVTPGVPKDKKGNYLPQVDCEKCLPPRMTPQKKAEKKAECKEDCDKTFGAAQSKVQGAFRAFATDGTDTAEGDICEAPEDPSDGSTGQKVYCSCNKKVYDKLADCQSECKVSLGCFTGICGPVK